MDKIEWLESMHTFMGKLKYCTLLMDTRFNAPTMMLR